MGWFFIYFIDLECATEIGEISAIKVTCNIYEWSVTNTITFSLLFDEVNYVPYSSSLSNFVEYTQAARTKEYHLAAGEL